MVLQEEKVFRTGSMIYRCLSELGRGQTATVYRAVREDCEGHTRQVVALKVLNHLDFVQSLRHEFEVLSKMPPNTCAKVLAWENFNTDGVATHALVLDWIEGATLAELQSENILKAEWSDEIVGQLEIALQDLEANGLYHGDLSPVNIMIDRRGRVRLIDFATDNKSANGTINYVSPERWAGAALSIETDLFALGLLHHDLKTGFADLRSTEVEAKDRALHLARAEAGHLLSIDPDSRDYNNFVSNAVISEAMGADVLRFLNRKSSVMESTRPIEIARPSPVRVPKTQSSRFFPVAGFLAALMMISISVQAEAPRELANLERGSLNVATHAWVHLWLNGRDVGYSPLRLHRILPGTHRVRWQTAQKSGEIQIKVSPGAQLKLTEEDFSKLE